MRHRDCERVFWTTASVVVTLLVAIPVLVVFFYIGSPSDGVWQHLQETLLWEYSKNSFLLAVGVALGSLVIGTVAAWLVTTLDFPGNRFFKWALLLPMAIPPYLLAYVFTDMLQFSGPLQTGLRNYFDWSKGDYWFPEARSLLGAIVILTLNLYPYVYLAARAAFVSQSGCLLEASRTLGAGPWRSFYQLALPLARPAIAAGTALAVMESLAEFGAVDYCAVDTLSTGIYRAWISRGSLVAAAQLSACLMLVVLCLVSIEKVARNRSHYAGSTVHYRRLTMWKTSMIGGIACFSLCFLPVLVGFIIPAGTFLVMTLKHGDARAYELLWELGTNTVVLGTIAAVSVTCLGLVVAYVARMFPGRISRWCELVSTLGYAFPGAVIAIGVLVFLLPIEDHVLDILETMSENTPGLFLTGTIAAILVGYHTRFLSITVGLLSAGLKQIQPSIDQASRTLGAKASSSLVRVHVPMLRTTIVLAMLFVFVEVVKELPVTLILAPFNFQTLAVRVHQLASDERLAESSTCALAMIVIGLLPVFFMTSIVERLRSTSHE